MKKDPLRHIPNMLTFARIAGSIVIFIWFINQHFWSGYEKIIFLILLLSTDWLDGFLARRYRWITNLGKMLDPIADKILLNGVMIVMIVLPELRLPWILVTLVVIREIGITVWRMMLARKDVIIPADTSGKIKTMLQSILSVLGCVWVFGIRHGYWKYQISVAWAFLGLFYIIVIITLFSGGMILWKFYFSKHQKDNR